MIKVKIKVHLNFKKMKRTPVVIVRLLVVAKIRKSFLIRQRCKTKIIG